MKKFLVYASYITYLKTEIEAETAEQARDIAEDMDGGDFKDTGFGDWFIDEIVEVR
jgi:hypothetical protein